MEQCVEAVPENRGVVTGGGGFPGAPGQDPRGEGALRGWCCSSEPSEMSPSHLLVVVLLLQSLQAAAVRLPPHGHVRLLLQEVQAQLAAAAQAGLQAQHQAVVLLGHRAMRGEALGYIWGGGGGAILEP